MEKEFGDLPNTFLLFAPYILGESVACITGSLKLSIEVYNNNAWLYREYKLVSDDARWLMFIYLTKIKGVNYRELGITRAYGNMIKNRKRRITNELLDKILEKLLAKDLLILMYSLKEIENGNENPWARRLAWLGRRPYERLVKGVRPVRRGGGPGFKSPRAHSSKYIEFGNNDSS